MEQEIRVCLFGATGYTGLELLRLLINHPNARVVSLTSQSHAGKRLVDLFPFFEKTYLADKVLSQEPEEDFDLAFLCLPHEASMEEVPRLLEKGKRVIDLSGAYRMKDPSKYAHYYGFEHTYTELLLEAVYGLPEIFREEIRGSRLVANPGCYPTATLLALYPLVKHGFELDWVVVDALSGVSGAGRKPVQKFHYPEMEGNAFAYSVQSHRHTPEMEDVLGRISKKSPIIRFVPQVIPVERGMMAKVYIKCQPEDYRSMFRETFLSEPFVTVVDEPPQIKFARGTNHCFLYTHYDQRTSTLLVISVIDNLGKGASSQAVQNLNIMFGLEETTALKNASVYP